MATGVGKWPNVRGIRHDEAKTGVRKPEKAPHLSDRALPSMAVLLSSDLICCLLLRRLPSWVSRSVVSPSPLPSCGGGGGCCPVSWQ